MWPCRPRFCGGWDWPSTRSQRSQQRLEVAVAEVWCRVLALPAGGIKLSDSFLELGGESLLALRVCAALRYELAGREAPDDDEAPGAEEAQFGQMSGAFAVSELLMAPSLAEYCIFLRRHNVTVDAAGQASEGESSVNRGGSKPEAFARRLCQSARQRGPGARQALASLLDSVSQQESARWCGATRDAGFNALHAAAQGNAVECLQLLLERKAKTTSTEGGAAMMPMHYAAMAKGPEALNLLLNAKAPLTVRDARGQSLLHAAARSGADQCVKYLLQMAEKEKQGVRQRNGEARKLLEWSDRWARTAVHWAALNGHVEVLKLLLDAKANAAPKLITEHQMAKRTHLVQEQPLDVALRVHGPNSEVVRQLQNALEEEDPLRDDKDEDAQLPEYVMTLSQGGLDRLALWELRRLRAKNIKRVQCRIFFRASCGPHVLASLKSAEKVCAVVLRADGQELASVLQKQSGDGDQKLQALANWLTDAPGWRKAIATWWKFNGTYGTSEGSEGSKSQTPLTFKITCRRSGKKFAEISSQGLAVAAASAIAARQGWRAQVRRPDLEVRILVSDSDILVDLPLLVQSSMRLAGELSSSGMAAPVAWAMARCAELQPGERVLDPMCGKAVILVEAALSWPLCHYIGIDIDAEQLAGANSNAFLAAASGARLDLLQGDACRLPLPDASVEVVICDIPFGRQYGTIEGCRDTLYKAILEEFDRVIKPGPEGRAVLISSLEQEPWVIKEAKLETTEAAWRCSARRELKLGFLDASIVVLRRRAPGEAIAAVPELSKRLWSLDLHFCTKEGANMSQPCQLGC
ncbi:unnamed protein product [Cladocopium goreaui]|uniref:UPF0020 domain-containing protein n=1 Tax=Cladocopium goreaui TaxID=2562237 RepID=A0A9P1GKX9_9DINO|nr:unnamed protein product [Cladocopium goreaui]